MTRDELNHAGEAMRERLGHKPDHPGSLGSETAAPGFTQLMTDAVYGGVWSRPGLPLNDRMICSLAVCGLRAPSPQLKLLVTSALDLGIPARSVLEVFVQSGLYGGFITTEQASTQARDVFHEQGIHVAEEPDRQESLEWLDESGRKVMKTLHGERAGAGYASPDNAITAALYTDAIRFGYGDLWSRAGLSFRERLLCAIAAFTSLRLESQIVKFSRAAMDNGFQRSEVVEAIIQTAPYSGYPGALNALALVEKATA